MHVLVATDGTLDIPTTAEFAKSLAGDEGHVTVLAVVEVPRQFLRDMRIQWGAAPDGAGVFPGDEYVDTPAVPREAPRGWPGDDALIQRYLADKLDVYTGPMVEALTELGVEAEPRVVESENVATTLLEEINTLDIDVVIIGTHGRGVFQGLIGSTGTKVVRRSTKPVLLIRAAVE